LEVLTKMPVNTMLTRNGEMVPLRWGRWHLNCLADAMVDECPNVNLYMGFPNDKDPNGDGDYGEFTFLQTHHYEDPSDGEVFIIHPGDRYKAWR
jgi:hypothetical protein